MIHLKYKEGHWGHKRVLRKWDEIMGKVKMTQKSSLETLETFRNSSEELQKDV